MFAEFNIVIIDPLNRDIDITELKSIPGSQIGQWENVKGVNQMKVFGMSMFYPWLAEFCIKNGLLRLCNNPSPRDLQKSKNTIPFEPLEKTVNLLEFMMLLGCMKQADDDTTKNIMMEFVKKEEKMIKTLMGYEF